MIKYNVMHLKIRIQEVELKNNKKNIFFIFYKQCNIDILSFTFMVFTDLYLKMTIIK